MSVQNRHRAINSLKRLAVENVPLKSSPWQGETKGGNKVDMERVGNSAQGLNDFGSSISRIKSSSVVF